ncbi:hypothetical protein Emag_003422 [Eimeria magna]
MAPLFGISVGWCLVIALCSSPHALANQSTVSEDIVLNGASEAPPPVGYDPFLAKLHIRNGSAFASLSGGSLSQQNASASDQSPTSSAANAFEEELKNGEEGGFSALQTSENSAECSCVFAGRCLYKGACLWVAATLAFGVILILFLTAWALQWMVAIPAETKTAGSSASDSAPLLKS